MLTVMLVLSFYSCFHINNRIKFVGGNLFDNFYCKVFLLGYRFIKPERDILSYSAFKFRGNLQPVSFIKELKLIMRT